MVLKKRIVNIVSEIRIQVSYFNIHTSILIPSAFRDRRGPRTFTGKYLTALPRPIPCLPFSHQDDKFDDGDRKRKRKKEREREKKVFSSKECGI